jgi:hypothetical protein
MGVKDRLWSVATTRIRFVIRRGRLLDPVP